MESPCLWHLGTQFRDDHDGAGARLGLDLNGLVQPQQFHDPKQQAPCPAVSQPSEAHAVGLHSPSTRPWHSCWQRWP